MLQPRNYPALIGKALFLEPEAFLTLSGDDEPVVEGAFLVTLVGLLAGVARLAGGLLLSWSLPPAAALASVFGRTGERLVDAGFVWSVQALERLWLVYRFFAGYDTGWARLLVLVGQPFLLLAFWLLAGTLLFAFGRALGGRGTLQQVLGATSLAVAPTVLLVATALPFVSVGGVLLAVWAMLLLYRAAQVTHELAWPHSAVAALLSVTLAGVLAALALLAVVLLTLL